MSIRKPLLIIVCLMCCIPLLSPGVSFSEIPLPTEQSVIQYSAIVSPSLSNSASSSRPLALGPVDTEHDLKLQVKLNSFSGPVDLYLGISAPPISPDIFLFNPSGALVPIADGFVPWETNTMGPVSKDLMGILPLSNFPSGDYIFYLLSVPAGTPYGSLWERSYLWSTSLSNLRAVDVANWAGSLFNGDVQAATSILLAIGNNYSLEETIEAIRYGTLSEFGNIIDASSGARQLRSESESDLCSKIGILNASWCRDAILGLIQDLDNELDQKMKEKSAFLRDAGETELQNLTSALTIIMSEQGYSARQIYEGLLGASTAGSSTIYWNEGLPKLSKNCPPYPTADCSHSTNKFIQPEIDRSEIASLFSDLNPEDFETQDDDGSDDSTDDEEGLWVDYPYADITTASFLVSLVINGSDYGLSEAMSCDNCITTNGSTSDPVRLRYEPFFSGNSVNMFGGQEEFHIIGEIADYGAVFRGSLDWSVTYPPGTKAPNGTPIPSADAFIQAELPFRRLSTVGGKASVEYGVTGIAACNYVRNLDINNQTDFSCNESSIVLLRFY